MTAPKHTPTPWAYDSDEGTIHDANGDLVLYFPTWDTFKGTPGEDLVRAVNSHAALVEALRACDEFIQDGEASTESICAIQALISAALEECQ